MHVALTLAGLNDIPCERIVYRYANHYKIGVFLPTIVIKIAF